MGEWLDGRAGGCIPHCPPSQLYFDDMERIFQNIYNLKNVQISCMGPNPSPLHWNVGRLKNKKAIRSIFCWLRNCAFSPACLFPIIYQSCWVFAPRQCATFFESIPACPVPPSMKSAHAGPFEVVMAKMPYLISTIKVHLSNSNEQRRQGIAFVRFPQLHQFVEHTPHGPYVRLRIVWAICKVQKKFCTNSSVF